MDPDEALRICLDPSRPEDERHDAGLALQGWLRRGGFPPGAWIVEEAGVTGRQRLYPGSRCRLFLERHDRHWAIVYTGSSDLPRAMVWRLRAKATKDPALLATRRPEPAGGASPAATPPETPKAS